MRQLTGMALVSRDGIFRIVTPRRVLCVLLLLICNQLALLSWRIWLSPDLPQTTLVSVVSADTARTADVRNSERFTLFGNAAESPPPAGETRAVSDSLRDAPLSALKLQVTGIVASQDPARSIAIIAKDSRQFSQGIGDAVPGYEAKIAAIFADRVIIAYQGRYESLLLFSDRPAAVSVRASQSTAQLKQQLQKQPQSILNYLNISPVMVENRLTGYRLNPGKQGELFQRVGLQENDLAVALNGLDLRDAQQAQQALKQLPELSELNLTVERDGQLQDIYFALGDD